MEMDRHVQSIQNRKFVIFLEYCKNKNVHEVYFLHADKHECFLEADTKILSVFGQT